MEPSFKINDMPGFHWEIKYQEYDDVCAAAKWAWTGLCKLALVFCNIYCKNHGCTSDNKNESTNFQSWVDIQKEFHESLAFLPKLTGEINECPACEVVKALMQFPILTKYSLVPPVAIVRLNAVDCYPDIIFNGRINNESIPCCVISTDLDGFENEIQNKTREMALLKLNLRNLPPLPPLELDKIKKNFEPGQKVVKILEVLCSEDKQREVLECILPSVVTALFALQELYQIRQYYPNNIDNSEAEKLHNELVLHLESFITNPVFVKYKIYYAKPEFENPASVQQIMVLKALLMFQHKDMQFDEVETDEIKKNCASVASKCYDKAIEPVKKIASRIIEMERIDCKVPHPIGIAEYYDTKRFLQMLRLYWGVCKKLVFDQIEGLLYYNVHPLFQIILNYKERINICFDNLIETNGGTEAKKSFNALIEILLSKEPDTLSMAEEWSNEQIYMVDMFIEENYQKMGAKAFELTNAEKQCLEYGEQSLVNYLNQSKIDWEHMQDDARINKVTNIVHNEYVMGDKYYVENAGGVGPNSYTTNININDIDLREIQNVLMLLQSYMKQTPEGNEHHDEINIVEEAIELAKRGNKTKVLQHLKKAGKWTLSVAERIGIGLVTEIIKQSSGFGLPRI